MDYRRAREHQQQTVRRWCLLVSSRTLTRSSIHAGYRIVGDPDHAHYILQANILQVGKVAPSAAQEAFGGYGAPLGGAFLGAAAAASFGSTHAAPIAGAALAGGLIELVANAAVKDVYYTAITDVQIKERQHSGKHPVKAP
ncbi:hypothetical protein F6X40_42180 [Paraburkholderia sp. UCT31]|uniref:complement resistance protein TraT n=1 Tax=Paraburkholderia sp. UCT31 TaxID=2615209 RepID=UPI001655E124|nr:complement resistance protein TraT [Paraburkholderia sp. UCT31]MBC8743042.1 hypothetical protein [Paraburkholderia sp. UCT31]